MNTTIINSTAFNEMNSYFATTMVAYFALTSINKTFMWNYNDKCYPLWCEFVVNSSNISVICKRPVRLEEPEKKNDCVCRS